MWISGVNCDILLMHHALQALKVKLSVHNREKGIWKRINLSICTAFTRYNALHESPWKGWIPEMLYGKTFFLLLWNQCFKLSYVWQIGIKKHIFFLNPSSIYSSFTFKWLMHKKTKLRRRKKDLRGIRRGN